MRGDLSPEPIPGAQGRSGASPWKVCGSTGRVAFDPSVDVRPGFGEEEERTCSTEPRSTDEIRASVRSNEKD
jgi:hypothetical protein